MGFCLIINRRVNVFLVHLNDFFFFFIFCFYYFCRYSKGVIPCDCLFEILISPLGLYLIGNVKI